MLSTCSVVIALTLHSSDYVAEYESAKTTLETQNTQLVELRAEVESLTEERASLQTKLAAQVDSAVSTELAAAAQSEVGCSG